MMIRDSVRLVVTDDSGFGHFNMYVWMEGLNSDKIGVLHAAPTFTMIDRNDPQSMDRPLALFTLSQKELQYLMDSMWRKGIRPSNGEGSVGEIGALKYHLEDMRKLVFKEKR